MCRQCVGTNRTNLKCPSFDREAIINKAALNDVSQTVAINRTSVNLSQVEQILQVVPRISDQQVKALFEDQSDRGKEKIIQPVEKRLNMMLAIIQEYENAKASYTNANDDDGTESKKAIIAVHFFTRFFELFGSSEQNYTTFKTLGLFLAALIEAKKPDQVAAVLDTFIDDQAAYRAKRIDGNTAAYSLFTLPAYNAESSRVENMHYTGSCTLFLCENTWFIASYFGVSLVNLPDEDTLERETTLRAFGPVGIEYKALSIYGAPITVNVSPFDVGNYISNELQDVEYTAKFSDIVAPSVFVTYSMKDRPFSVMLGYQKDVKIGNEIEENTWFLSFGFDLPIFTIY